MTEITQIESIEDEFKEIEKVCGWKELSKNLKADADEIYPYDKDASDENYTLNRYNNIYPFDHSRVVLKDASTDYINASHVKVESVGRRYILTQGPLQHTTGHFWLMVWQQQCRVIVMLNNLIENRVRKCDLYWPEGGKHPDVLKLKGGLKVELLSKEKHHHYIQRTFRLHHAGSSSHRDISHFHYTNWPDFGVPESPASFNRFLKAVIKNGGLSPSVGPAVVHCSAGVGRSGTFCLVDSVLLMLERGLVKEDSKKTVVDTLQGMRQYRRGLVQSEDQLRFSFQAIVHAATSRLSDNSLVSYTDKWGVVYTGLRINVLRIIDPRLVVGV